MCQGRKTRSESEMDSDNLAMMDNMLHKEQTIYVQHDYLARSIPLTSITPDSNGNCFMPVDAFCRNIMAKWCVSLCKFCSYDRRMVASVMSCVDRFVATPRGSRILLDRDQYQLAVMSSLYLIAKIQQTQALEPESIAKLSRGKYTKANIEDMELQILTSLKWYVNPPTPESFAREFLQNFDFCPEKNIDDSDGDLENDESLSSTSATEEMILDLVKCQIEEATCDYELSCLARPSHVAFGALSNALESLNVDSSELESMKLLKDRLQILRDDHVSTALLRVISTSEVSNCSLSSLLLHRCSGHSKRPRSDSQSQKAEQRSTDPVSPRTSTSRAVVPSSPRTVLDGILC